MWLKDNMAPDYKLTKWERAGGLKHLVGLSVVIGGLRTAFGFDYSSISGISIAPDKITEGEGLGRLPLRTGVFGFRPSPAFQIFESVQTVIFTENEYDRAEAIRDLKVLGLIPIGTVAPGGLLGRDLVKAAKSKDRTKLLFKMASPRKSKRHKRRKPTPFVPFTEFPSRPKAFSAQKPFG